MKLSLVATAALVASVIAAPAPAPEAAPEPNLGGLLCLPLKTKYTLCKALEDILFKDWNSCDKEQQKCWSDYDYCCKTKGSSKCSAEKKKYDDKKKECDSDKGKCDSKKSECDKYYDAWKKCL